MADAFGLPVALVNSPARYAAHVGTVLPNHLMMEVIDPGPDVVLTADDRLEGGSIVLGEAPGLGITFDEERAGAACRRAAVRRGAEPALSARARLRHLGAGHPRRP